MSLFSHASSCPPPTRAALGAPDLFSNLFSWRPPAPFPALLSTRASPFPLLFFLSFFLHCLTSRGAPPRLHATPQEETLAGLLVYACHLQRSAASRGTNTNPFGSLHFSGLFGHRMGAGAGLECHGCLHVFSNHLVGGEGATVCLEGPTLW